MEPECFSRPTLGELLDDEVMSVLAVKGFAQNTHTLHQYAGLKVLKPNTFHLGGPGLA